jgi:tetratricopeptide (TPR) repeat protein
MKKIITAILLVLVQSAMAQLSGPPSGDNQKSSITQWIGLVSVTINYSSPDVHTPSGEDRKGHIWGELVHYGFIDQGYGPSKAAPWRAGANENTTIAFSHDVQIDGKPLKAGTYGLFLDVEKDGPWQWIFSKNSNAWGSYYYNQSEDALRVKSTPTDNAYNEWLTYGFDDRQPSSTSVYLAWENKKAGFKVEVPNVYDLYVDKIKQELDGTTIGFSYDSYARAARFCAQHKVQLEQGLKWADNALTGKKDYSTLSAKAMVLTAMGKDQEGSDVMAAAIKEPTASVQDVHQYGRFLLDAGKKEKALEVFQLNRKQHPDDKFTTYVGLARGFTAIGDKKSAIKNWETAIKNIPEDQKQNAGAYEAELKKLKS